MLSAALVLILVPQAVFLAVYGTTRPWWRSWEGRALIASSLGWSLIAAGFLVDTYIEVTDRVWIAVACVAVVAAWLKLWILVQARRSARSS